MDEELFVHLTTVGALWYSRVLYAFESSEERRRRGLVKKVYCTRPLPNIGKEDQYPRQLGPVGLECFFLICLPRLFTNSCQSLQFRSTLYQFLKLSLVVRLRPL